MMCMTSHVGMGTSEFDDRVDYFINQAVYDLFFVLLVIFNGLTTSFYILYHILQLTCQ